MNRNNAICYIIPLSKSESTHYVIRYAHNFMRLILKSKLDSSLFDLIVKGEKYISTYTTLVVYVKAVNRNDSEDLPSRVLVKKEKDTTSTYNNMFYYYKAMLYLL